MVNRLVAGEFPWGGHSSEEGREGNDSSKPDKITVGAQGKYSLCLISQCPISCALRKVSVLLAAGFASLPLPAPGSRLPRGSLGSLGSAGSAEGCVNLRVARDA